jgi:DNA-binding transcriptional MerR regulator
MKKSAARSSGFGGRLLSIGEAAEELGLERRLLRAWRKEFSLFEDAPDKRFTTRDLSAARALKRLLIDEHYSFDETRRLIAEAGPGAVIAVYGAAPAVRSNPAHVLQAAVHSAAAAGFFGAVVAEFADDNSDDGGSPEVASYAQARLARLSSGER